MWSGTHSVGPGVELSNHTLEAGLKGLVTLTVTS